MKFSKTQIKSTETQFENAKTQFQKCENSIYRGPTGVDWPRNALKKNLAILLESNNFHDIHETAVPIRNYIFL